MRSLRARQGGHGFKNRSVARGVPDPGFGTGADTVLNIHRFVQAGLTVARHNHR